MYKYYNVLYIDNYYEDSNLKNRILNIIKKLFIDSNINVIIKNQSFGNIDFDYYDFEKFDLVIMLCESEDNSQLMIKEKLEKMKIPFFYFFDDKNSVLDNPIILAEKVYYLKKNLKAISKEYILLNFSLLNDKEYLWLKEQIEIAVQILLNKGNIIKVIPLNENYEYSCREFVDTFQNENIMIQENFNDINELLNLIDKSKFCINFHENAALLCAAMKKPFILVDDINNENINELIISNKEVNVGRILEKLEYVNENYESIKEKLENKIESYYSEKIEYIKSIFNDIVPKEKNIVNSEEKPRISEFSDNLKKLHLGCGRTILQGWINLDCIQGEGIDVIADLDDCKNTKLPFEDNSIDVFYASHVIEHINNTLDLMQELHRIAKPGAKAMFKCPYGSSDEAFEDPTHVRQYFKNSFNYFSQSFYWKADYGYRGNWSVEKIMMKVDGEKYKNVDPNEILKDVDKYRNVVEEMMVELKAIKPIREAKQELNRTLVIEFVF